MYLNESIVRLLKSLGKGSAWITDSVVGHNINISNYKHLSGSSYIKLSKALDHLKKGLIDIQNTDDNKQFTWCLVRHLHPADHHTARIRKLNKNFAI